jgi:hypothetical protein
MKKGAASCATTMNKMARQARRYEEESIGLKTGPTQMVGYLWATGMGRWASEKQKQFLWGIRS